MSTLSQSTQQLLTLGKLLENSLEKVESILSAYDVEQTNSSSQQ